MFRFFFPSVFLIFFPPLPLIAAIAFDYRREGWCRRVEGWGGVVGDLSHKKSQN